MVWSRGVILGGGRCVWSGLWFYCVYRLSGEGVCVTGGV